MAEATVASTESSAAPATAEGGAKVEGGEKGIGTQADQISAIVSDYLSDGKEEKVETGKEEGEEAVEEGKSEEGEVKVEAEKEEVVKPEEKKESVDEGVVAKLQAQILELTNKLTELSAPKPKVEAKPDVAVPQKQAPEEKVLDIKDFISSPEEYNQIFEDQATLGKVLGRVHTKAVQDTLRAVPQIVSNTVKETIPIMIKTEKFFTDNNDLNSTDKRKFVGFVANDLSGKNPDWSLDKLFSELGKEVRTRLGMKQEAQQKVTGRPAFVKGSGSRKPLESKPDLSPLEQQIADIL